MFKELLDVPNISFPINWEIIFEKKIVFTGYYIMKSIFKNTEQMIDYAELKMYIMYENGNILDILLCRMRNQPSSIKYIKAFNDLGSVMPNLNFPISKMDILDYILNGTIQGKHINDHILENIVTKRNNKLSKILKSNELFKYCSIIVKMAKCLRNYRSAFINHTYHHSIDREKYTDLTKLPFYKNIKEYSYGYYYNYDQHLGSKIKMFKLSLIL